MTKYGDTTHVTSFHKQSGTPANAFIGRDGFDGTIIFVFFVDSKKIKSNYDLLKAVRNRGLLTCRAL